MKTFILILLLAGTLAISTKAQKLDREIYPKQASIEHNDAVKSFSGDFVSFFSNSPILGNLQQMSMDANQVANIRTIGDENMAILSQMGVSNIGIINILGNENNASLEQRGNRLFSVLDIRGNSNSLDVLQDGMDLQNFLQITGSGLAFDVHQTNAGLQLMQSGMGSIPMSIQQTGRSIPIIISNN